MGPGRQGHRRARNPATSPQLTGLTGDDISSATPASIPNGTSAGSSTSASTRTAPTLFDKLTTRQRRRVPGRPQHRCHRELPPAPPHDLARPDPEGHRPLGERRLRGKMSGPTTRTAWRPRDHEATVCGKFLIDPNTIAADPRRPGATSAATSPSRAPPTSPPASTPARCRSTCRCSTSRRSARRSAPSR